MSTVAAMASYSSLNPNAPLFIPAAYRQVEDFSPEWWELVKTTAWFRDHWFRHNHHLHDADAAFTAADDADDFDVAALLPDDLDMVDTDDLFYAPDVHHHHQQVYHQAAVKLAPMPALMPGYDLDVLRAVSLSSPVPVNAAPSPRALQHQHHHHQQHQRHADKPAWHAGARAAARRGIHQPR